MCGGLRAGDGLPQRLHGLTRDGRLFTFAANNIMLAGESKAKWQKAAGTVDFRRDEWAGATFSRDGKWLFVNLQVPGLTVAITGPWKDGLI